MPGGDFHPVYFSIVAIWIIACGIGVVASRRVVRAAVYMVLCFLGVAFAFALMNSALLAIVQVLIYVGAISVVIIFGIMLTQSVDGPSTEFFNRQSIFAAPLAVAAAALVAVILVSSDLLDAGDKALNPGVDKFSELLFNRYVFPFELISLLLLAAMVGAIVLARKEERQ
jgi:NADH-quinone oxidoreductase subunit J